ncbi:MAG: arsenite methyltransferase [Planctomycetota bacterium]|nr:arsenite methyltransferase [Planctomycetota bacterium]
MKRDGDVHKAVREAYARVARGRASCCGTPAASSGSGCCGGAEKSAVPEADMGLSFGNPVAFLQLEKGDIVLDLGCGGGKDVFLAAEKVGPGGRVIGVDMTPEMLALAEKNVARFRERTGLSNVEFREGLIEKIPARDGEAEAVISNCVINLSPDKPAVFREIFRVLKPGGRMIVSDIVLDRPLPDALRNDEDLYMACLAGAAMRRDYIRAIRQAGFRRVRLLADSPWIATAGRGAGKAGGANGRGCNGGCAADAEIAAASITVLAVKPAGSRISSKSSRPIGGIADRSQG